MIKDLKLDSTDHICNKCHGEGQVNWITNQEQQEIYEVDTVYVECDKCHGEGKLDWIENIVGKPPKKSNNVMDMNKRLLSAHVQKTMNTTYKELLYHRTDPKGLSDNDVSKMECIMEDSLTLLRSRRALIDYNINVERRPNPLTNNNEVRFDVDIQPFRTVETLRVSMLIT